ncbi:hypothetical protein HNR46_001282 [Haloferula luteola]|uniref:Uncharacterized protein n=1 Tax=Haloferula luteola TaxID=595692 RepID=A0A840V8J3_9BACT|nr:hypothetical protein [Haloferula luteola]MBB5351048.1 hypothetical protein [Haloferula luteola]
MNLMRPLLFLAGALTMGLGVVSMGSLNDPGLLQGALTLGGGWLICAGFSFRSYWHGVIGAGVLGLLGATRCAPAWLKLTREPTAPWEAASFIISAVVLIVVVKALLAERARRTREELLRQD